MIFKQALLFFGIYTQYILYDSSFLNRNNDKSARSLPLAEAANAKPLRERVLSDFIFDLGPMRIGEGIEIVCDTKSMRVETPWWTMPVCFSETTDDKDEKRWRQGSSSSKRFMLWKLLLSVSLDLVSYNTKNSFHCWACCQCTQVQWQ